MCEYEADFWSITELTEFLTQSSMHVMIAAIILESLDFSTKATMIPWKYVRRKSGLNGVRRDLNTFINNVISSVVTETINTRGYRLIIAINRSTLPNYINPQL